MKPPISYYGGKQQLSSMLVSLIPKHTVYVEPFVGGGAVFFAKKPAKVEVINDMNGEMINFYSVMQNDFDALQKMVSCSLHSRQLHHDAHVVFENPHMFNRIKRAWAIYVLANLGFCKKLNATFGYDLSSLLTRSITEKRNSFTKDYAIRLQNTQLECCDALRIIESRDTKETFFYLDPPYVGTFQGHYNGYNQDDFNALLAILTSIKGKFLLSSFRNTELTEHIKKNGWHSAELKKYSSMKHTVHEKQKIEVITMNYSSSTLLLEE